MRPIEKKTPGDKIYYTDSNNQLVEHIIQKHYPNYGNAKFPLTGKYRSILFLLRGI